jgi:hypothetical protein
VLRATVTRLLFITAFLPLALGMFTAVIDWAQGALEENDIAEDVILTHMIDTEAWAKKGFELPSDGVCGTVNSDGEVELSNDALKAIVIPSGTGDSLAFKINDANGMGVDAASSILSKWMGSDGLTANEMSSIVHLTPATCLSARLRRLRRASPWLREAPLAAL